MRVLVACEESQAVTIAFRERGHEAYSCDLLDCSGGHPEWHRKTSVVHLLYEEWDMIIAHPPCTRLCNSGVRWLNERDLWQEMYFACEFFNLFQSYAHNNPGAKVGIENPIPHKYATEYIGKYTQLIQPWMFGHKEIKATCLWLYGLPELKPTDIVGPPPKDRDKAEWDKVHRASPGEDRALIRSKTFPGIAKAMAETVATISKANSGPRSEESKSNAYAGMMDNIHLWEKKVIQVDLTTGIDIKVWDSALKAASGLGIKGAANISTCCSKRPYSVPNRLGTYIKKSVGGYGWRYA